MTGLIDTTWSEVLGVDREPVLCSTDPYWGAERSLGRVLDDLDVIRQRLASVESPGYGFEGVAAGAFLDLTETIADQIEPFFGPLEAIKAAMGNHAEDLLDLRLRAYEGLVEAVERVEHHRELGHRVDQTRREIDASAGDDFGGAAFELDALERRHRNAAEAVGRSHDAYHRFMRDEEELNQRTSAVLEMNPLPAFEAVMTTMTGLTLGSDGDGRALNPVWNSLQGSFQEAGINVSNPIPPPHEYDEGARWMDNGVLHIQVGGPKGGPFAIGPDIRPAVYSVILHLLNGELPDFRPWDSDLELNDAEVAAFWWAAGTNWSDPGEGPQSQVGGINGSLQSYFEGGSWTPQRFWKVDGLNTAVSAAGSSLGMNGAIAHMAAGSVVMAVRDGMVGPALGGRADPAKDDERDYHFKGPSE